jgi:hypothetical protein
MITATAPGDSRAVALEYLRRGWTSIPLPARKKAPRTPGWQSLRLGADDVPSRFSQNANVGVLLGEPSGWLVDVDLDAQQATELADEFLPATAAEFGRAGKPRSHRLYVVTGPIDTAKWQTSDRQMIVELRSTGTQTVFPGSIHPSGERVEWHAGGEPTTITPEALRAACERLAAEVRRRLGDDQPRNGHHHAATGGRASVVDRARRYLDKLPPAVSGQGGHAQTLQAACELYRFGLDDSNAHALLDEYNGRCSPAWTSKEIDHKLADARKLVEAAGELGCRLHEQNGKGSEAVESSAPTGTVTNASTSDAEGDGKKAVPLTMAQIISRTAEQTGDWPRRVGTALFVDDSAHGIAWLERSADLFGWLHRRVGKVRWRDSIGCVRQPEFFSELRRTSKQYAAIETLPHEPLMADHYYSCGSITPGDGATLRELLDRFNPATGIDRDLLLAAIVTPGWGGPPGARPAFLFTSDDGRGAGKSTAAELIAEPWGGVVTFEQNEDASQMRTRLLSADSLPKRVALLDNIKTLRFSWATLEAMITAGSIDGKRMYVGQACRPNTLTWFLTLNGASLSTDMAQRVVTIKINRPTYAGTWKEKTSAFIHEHRDAILADVVAFLRSDRHQPARFTRWASWESDVLSRLPEPNEAQAVILERQGTVDVEREEAEAIEESIGEQLAKVGYKIATECVFIPSATICRWYDWATGKRESVTAVSRILGQMIDEGRTMHLRRNKCKTYGRGFVWQPAGWIGTIATDLQQRIAKFMREKEEGQKDGT